MSGVSPVLTALLSEAQAIGAIGPATIEEHVRHALGFAALIPASERDGAVIDLGSGGGIPGLVLAEALPKARIALLEGRTQRAARLQDDIGQLGFSDRVTVIPQRAEEAAHDPALRGHFDVAVARGFGSPAVTAECAVGFLRIGGRLIVSEPPTGAFDLRWPEAGYHQLGLELERTVMMPFRYVILRQETLADDRFPRRVGVPSKRPLF